MKAKSANSTRLNILGSVDWLSDREILTATLKRWRQRLSYCSVFAAVPAILVSHLQVAHSEEAKRPEASVAGRGARFLERLNKIRSSPGLLKRQSKFLLPHQKGNFAMLAAVAGNDDCPGRAIPGGNYTAAAPYIESGDTTGANDTVSLLPSYYYYYSSYGAHGPDLVYSFTLTGLGPNPQIEVSTTSGTYKPLIYVLNGGSAGACPAGTGNFGSSEIVMADSRWTTGTTATLNRDNMNYLPLRVPLHLFVDSAFSDAAGSGPYTIRMQDVSIARDPNLPSAIDRTEVFVPQQYLDFLNRQPDPVGLAFWTNEIAQCGTDQQCIEVKRINVSAAFFLSIEFQDTGYLVYRFYKASYGNMIGAPVPIRLNEFLPDTKQIGQGVIVNQPGWETVLENNKQAFLAEFVQRSRFTSANPTSLRPDEFVDRLYRNAGVNPPASERTPAINEFGSATTTADLGARARVLRRVVENSTLVQQEFNRAFVLMQYFGYLRRNPHDLPEHDFQGYNFWLNKLNQFDGNFENAEMVKAFLSSSEYRQRFGP